MSTISSHDRHLQKKLAYVLANKKPFTPEIVEGRNPTPINPNLVQIPLSVGDRILGQSVLDALRDKQIYLGHDVQHTRSADGRESNEPVHVFDMGKLTSFMNLGIADQRDHDRIAKNLDENYPTGRF